ncbi:hypothetical protein ABZY36_03200 [Streptomyces sp. NPDC006627]|uniref:hypothetical protein n=1 Tax=Streptomyces sp. NPDC006627 TaxID=3154679 RepID=UPI0033A064AC
MVPHASLAPEKEGWRAHDGWTPTGPTPRLRAPRPWLRIFTTGLVLWLLTVAVTFATGNPNLVPTLLLLGSFLVSVTFVVWAFDRRETGELTPTPIFSTFLTGGVLGVLAASLLESYLLPPPAWLFVGVGLIEEAVKLGTLAALHALWDSMHDIALVLTLLFTGDRHRTELPVHGWLPRPTEEQVHLFTALSVGGLVVISVIGLGRLLALWRGHRHRPDPTPLPGWRVTVRPAREPAPTGHRR